MDSLGDILPKIMKSAGLRKRYKVELIISHWSEIVGAEIAVKTRPGMVHRGVMTVAAQNAAWAHHLTTLKEEIIAKINVFAGEKAVSDLKFQAGYFQKGQNQESDDGVEEFPAVNWREARLEGGEMRALEVLTAPLADSELRKRFKRLLGKELALKKAQRRRDWPPCRGCGVLRPPGEELCAVCAARTRAAARSAVRGLLRDAPWLSYEECTRYVDCRPSDYSAARDELADTMVRDIGLNEDDPITPRLLVMLINRLPPHAITDDIIATTLAKVRRKKNVFASRS